MFWGLTFFSAVVKKKTELQIIIRVKSSESSNAVAVTNDKQHGMVLKYNDVSRECFLTDTSLMCKGLLQNFAQSLWSDVQER